MDVVTLIQKVITEHANAFEIEVLGVGVEKGGTLCMYCSAIPGVFAELESSLGSVLLQHGVGVEFLHQREFVVRFAFLKDNKNLTRRQAVDLSELCRSFNLRLERPMKESVNRLHITKSKYRSLGDPDINRVVRLYPKQYTSKKNRRSQRQKNADVTASLLHQRDHRIANYTFADIINEPFSSTKALDEDEFLIRNASVVHTTYSPDVAGRGKKKTFTNGLNDLRETFFTERRLYQQMTRPKLLYKSVLTEKESMKASFWSEKRGDRVGVAFDLSDGESILSCVNTFYEEFEEDESVEKIFSKYRWVIEQDLILPLLHLKIRNFSSTKFSDAEVARIQEEVSQEMDELKGEHKLDLMDRNREMNERKRRLDETLGVEEVPRSKSQKKILHEVKENGKISKRKRRKANDVGEGDMQRPRKKRKVSKNGFMRLSEMEEKNVLAHKAEEKDKEYCDEAGKVVKDGRQVNSFEDNHTWTNGVNQGYSFPSFPLFYPITYGHPIPANSIPPSLFQYYPFPRMDPVEVRLPPSVDTAVNAYHSPFPAVNLGVPGLMFRFSGIAPWLLPVNNHNSSSAPS